jgi:hypothetical protein
LSTPSTSHQPGDPSRPKTFVLDAQHRPYGGRPVRIRRELHSPARCGSNGRMRILGMRPRLRDETPRPKAPVCTASHRLRRASRTD